MHYSGSFFFVSLHRRRRAIGELKHVHTKQPRVSTLHFLAPRFCMASMAQSCCAHPVSKGRLKVKS